MKFYPCIVLSVILAASASAQTIISININETNNRVPMLPGSLAGAPGVRTDNWNNMTTNSAPRTGSTLIYDDGSAIDDSFEVTFALPTGYAAETTNTNDVLMYTGSSNMTNANVASFTLENIPFAQYDIYVYARGQAGGGGRGGSVTLDGETYFIRNAPSVTDTGDGYVVATTTSYVPNVDPVTNVANANYAYFGGLSGADQTVSLQALFMGDASNLRFQVYGFQIVAVPEPGEYALFAGLASLLGLMIYRRRSRQ